jgi:hypothetical protein
MLIGLKIPPQQLFGFAAVPMVAGLFAAASIARLCHRRLGGMHLDEVAETTPSGTALRVGHSARART